MKNKIIPFLTLIAIIIILINILSDKFFFRIDFTEDQRYTLSDATKNVLKQINDPITVKAYFSENLPPEIAKNKRDFQEMIVEYANLVHGNMVYEFINPNENEQTEQEAIVSGIQPVRINVREKDQVKQQRAYLGAVIQIGDKKDVIPFLKPGGGFEYSLSTSLKKISITQKPLVGLLQGHGEPSVDALPQAIQSLSVLHQVLPITLPDTAGNFKKISVLMIIAPRDSFSPIQLKELSDYVANGGKTLIAINRVFDDFSTAQGYNLNTGLEGWLAQKGIIVEPSFVIDASCRKVSVPQQQEGMTFNVSVQFPYMPIITHFPEHVATKGIENIILQFASPIKFVGDKSIRVTPLALTSERSGVQPAPVFFDINRQWKRTDFTRSQIMVAGLFSGKFGGNIESQIVVISDGDFCINGQGQQAQQLAPDNINLLSNLIDFLTDDTGLIELRTKGVTGRPIDLMDDITKNEIKWLNFSLPIVLIILIGIFRRQYTNRLKNKRKEEGYV